VNSQRRRLRRVGRDVLVGLTSLVIAIVAVMTVVVPAHAAATMSVQQGNSIQPAGYEWRLPMRQFRPAAPRNHEANCQPGGPEVIYGSVTAKSGIRLSNITVEIDAVDQHGGHARPCGDISVGANGIYRSTVHLAAGQYRLTVHFSASGKKISESRTAHLQPGRVYQVSSIVRSSRIFSFLPVSSY